MENQFTIPPPEFNDSDRSDGFFPPSPHAAWILKLIQIQLSKSTIPDEMKDDIIMDMEVYVNNASMTNITQGQVKEFLGGFKELWMKYRIFKFRKKYWASLNVLETRIREIFIQNLNKSIDGFQPELVFVQKHDYDVRQTNRSQPLEPQRGIFPRRKQKQQQQEMRE